MIERNVKGTQKRPIDMMSDQDVAEEYSSYFFHKASFSQYVLEALSDDEELSMKERLGLLRSIYDNDKNLERYERYYEEEIDEWLSSDHPLAQQISSLYDRMHETLNS